MAYAVVMAYPCVMAYAMLHLLALCTLSGAAPLVGDLVLFLNGLPLTDRPFVDHSQRWPPRLTWTIIGGGHERGLQQVSYAVRIGDVRDGRNTSAPRHVVRPPPVRSNAAHDVELAVTLADGRVVRKTGTYRTALIGGGERFGSASWIGGGTLLRRSLSDLLVVVSSPAPKVVNATLFATGVGCFAIELDGQLVSNSFMDPGWGTLPTTRLTYRAFDVTPHFSSLPENLSVSLGMCKYGYQGSFCVGAHAATAACKAFLMSLRVSYDDGTERTIVTSASDGKWEATTSANPIRYAHLYHGEQYDGRVATDDPSQWRPATAATFNTGEGEEPAARALGTPVLLTMPALEVSKRYTPVSVSVSKRSSSAADGATKWVFDMGENQAGFATLSVPRSALLADAPVTLKYAEVLQGDGTVDMAWCNGKEGPDCDCSGINCANQTDTFVPAPPRHDDEADALVTWTPSFTYHGYRYVQVEGLADGYTPTSAALTGLFLHSAVRRTGNLSFPTQPVLDGIQRAIVQTQLANLHFHPTDCPQREKRGWTGDAQFTSRQASLNLDMRQLYGNWLQTMKDHDDAGCALNGGAPVFPQTNKDICCYPAHGSFGCDYTGIPNGTFTLTGGSVADVMPFMYVGGWPGDPSWGAIATVLPYTVWKGGDDALVAAFYDGAKRNVDFFNREAAADGLIEFGYYGDWLSLQSIGKPQVVATTQIMAVSHLVEMAQHLGKHDDVAAYNATLAALRRTYHNKYWDAAAKSYKGGTQTANLMPLILDIPPPTERALAAAAFVANVQRAGNATESGLVGASFVLQALVAAGRGDIALSMAMREEEPSWGYMVKQGPGTIWETWNDKSNSHNHPMFTASIGPYLYAIVGLDPSTWTIPAWLGQLDAADAAAETASLAEKITMHVTPDPHAVRALRRASGKVETLCGVVAVEWKLHDDTSAARSHFTMNASVPHNCGRARLVLHVPETLADHVGTLCVGGVRVSSGRNDQAGATSGSGSESEWVTSMRLAPDNRTIDVVVRGGQAELHLARCARTASRPIQHP